MNSENLIKEAIYTSEAENWKQYEKSTIELIKKLRPEVEKELFKKGTDHQEKLMQGPRFYDDKDVWHALIMNLEKSKDVSIFDDPKKLEKAVKEALKQAADTDYYYQYDKDYGNFDV